MKKLNTFAKIKSAATDEIQDYKVLMRNVPGTLLALFCISVVLMNLLANKEALSIKWLALDCGVVVSWMSFLTMDMLAKRFGPKAAFKVSLFASAVNLFICGIFYLISLIPGNWGAYYAFENDIINQGLNSTIGGTWYVILGSTIAFITSSIVNSIVNAAAKKIDHTNTFRSYAIRSYTSTLVAQFADNFVFALIVSHVFFGWSLIQCITCSITGCIVELLCEVVFSPLGYKVCKKWEKEKVGQEYLEYAEEVHN